VRALETATPLSRSRPPDGGAGGPKSASDQRIWSRRAVASGLLTVVGVMLGCLVPQDYRFSDDAPPFKNNPVKIMLPVEPDRTTLTLTNGVGGGTACVQDFTISATDPDLNDPITVQWFVDYDQNLNPSIYRERLLPNLGSPVRGPTTLHMDLNAPGNPLAPQATHVLEVLVGDGQIVNREPQLKSNDPDAGPNPSYVDRYVWVVKTEPGDCQLP
jgi:hypothetical protein